jgi:DNA-binding transcriptional LysR family regulator
LEVTGMLNLYHLRVFYYVAKNLSFTRAADELCITQPAVSSQMRQFEEWCELKFFKKKGRGIRLTDEGETLFEYARKIFEFERQIESSITSIEDMRKLKRGVLRIGSTRTYARYLMPNMMRHFHENYPDIKIFLDEGSSMDMSTSLFELKNEIAIIAKLKDDPAIEYIPFIEEEIVPILSPDHSLATRESLSIEHCSNEPIILRETGSATRKYIDDFFHQHNCTPNILMETANSDFIKKLVARGDGISFLVKQAVIEDLQAGRLTSVPFQNGKLFIDASIAYLKKQPLSLPAQAFLETIL